MSWASGRRTIIIGICVVILLLVLGGTAYLILHQAPSCFDGKQNQTEEGIDCGGTCTYLCNNALSQPRVSFTRALTVGERTDIVAYVENPNNVVAQKVPYTVELYSENRTVLAQKSGTVDLPPRDYGPIPIYIPNLYAGDERPAQAFLALDAEPKWYEIETTLLAPKADSPVVGGTEEAPRVTATFRNTSVETVRKMRVVAIIFDTEGNAIAASQTVLPDLGPLGSADAVFTWNEPFSAPVGRIDVRPVLVVPSP